MIQKVSIIQIGTIDFLGHKVTSLYSPALPLNVMHHSNKLLKIT